MNKRELKNGMCFKTRNNNWYDIIRGEVFKTAYEEHSLKYKYEHYIPKDVAERLRRAADAAFLLDQEMSEIREEIMKAQVMYQSKSITIREVLVKIQELYDLGEISRAINYQRRLDRIDSQKDIKEIVALKEEIEEILQYYKNTRIDD